MSAEVWGAAGIAVTALVSLIVAVTARKASPYEALATRVTYLEKLHDENTKKLDRQREELIKLRFERANDQTEIAGLQRRVAGMFDDRDDLVRYIVILRQWITAGARPPAPAVPVHLSDVLPAWVPGDGAEPPPRTRPDDPTGP